MFFLLALNLICAAEPNLEKKQSRRQDSAIRGQTAAWILGCTLRTNSEMGRKVT